MRDPVGDPVRDSKLVTRLAITAVILIALSAGGLAMCGLPGDSLDDGEGILGTYVVNGVDPTDVEYSGTVTISAGDAPGRYDVQWLVTGAILGGEGRLTGDRFVVEWTTITSPRGESSGSAEYVVGSDGVLRGERRIDGVDGVGTEEIFPEP